MHADKIMLDLSDNRELSELLSRSSVGQTVSFQGTASIDEVSEKLATLSIDTFKVEGPATESQSEEVQEGDEPAVKVFKGRRNEEGT